MDGNPPRVRLVMEVGRGGCVEMGGRDENEWVSGWVLEYWNWGTEGVGVIVVVGG
jgi:hypothetical protein